jgi:hypothetical protein
LHGWNKIVTQHFADNWDEGNIILHGRRVKVDEKLIYEVTNLSTKGKKFYRDRKFLKQSVQKFPKYEKDRRKLEKKSKRCYDIENFKSIWG